MKQLTRTIPRRAVLAALLIGVLVSATVAFAKVRPSAIAGSWYPAERSLVAVEVAQDMSEAAAAPALPQRPIALVVPHAGWRFSGVVAAAAYRNLHAGDFARVVIVGPSHHAAFEGFDVTDADAYQTPLGDVPICREAAAALTRDKVARPVPGAEDQEHSIEIQLPFLQQTLGSFCLVPIEAGETTVEQQKALAEKLAALNDGKTLYVFSSDFTHYGPRYGYAPFGPSGREARDKIRAQNTEAVDLLLKKDAAGFRAYIARTNDSICGRHGLGVLLELLPRIAPKASGVLLSRYASVDLPGFEDDSSVTYVALAYAAKKPEPAKALETPPVLKPCSPDAPPVGEDLARKVVELARAALKTELTRTDDLQRALASLPASRPELDRLQGVFVTLNRTDPVEIQAEGKLRGCIGQIFPVLPLREAVVHAAVSAALQDPRFVPVDPTELGRLAVEVTLLSPPKPIGSWREIKLGTHGIVLEKGDRRAVFLPQVPGEEGWTIEETLSHLSRKAGLSSDAWREGAKFSVFTGQVLEETKERTRPAR